MVVRHHNLLDLIITNQKLLFILKFWSLLCYFLGIKQKLSTVFYLQIDSQTEKQNNTIKAYLWVFINFKQNDWVWLLSMAEFAYNNIKKASTGQIPFELNYKYHLWVFYKKKLDSHSKLKTIEKLFSKL